MPQAGASRRKRLTRRGAAWHACGMHRFAPQWGPRRSPKGRRGLVSARLVVVAMIGMAAAHGWAQAAVRPLPGPRHAALLRIAYDRATPVVRPHGTVHAIRPRENRQPRLPLPLPPPLPEQETTPPPPKPAPAPAKPAKPAEEQKPEIPALPVPRFAALRTDDVNMRAGPGFRYPIEWVYKRRGLPMEIERDFEVWRLVQDPDGNRGWVHQATLTGRRTFIVEGAEATLRADTSDDAKPVAILKVGVIGRIRFCHKDSAWCRLQVGQYDGYLKRTQFWGTLPNEVIPAP